jgi:hypothetical protein
MPDGTLGPDGEHGMNPRKHAALDVVRGLRPDPRRWVNRWPATRPATRCSVPLRIVALDEATKRIYRRTDSATLVGLLPELRRLTKGAQKERERLDRAQDGNGEGDDSGSPVNGFDEKFSADLGAYVTSANDRELWIRTELKRRGLLPLWPGEQEHLDDDG